MKLGGLDISTVKLGANQVQAVYQGVDLVWQNAPVATAATGVGQLHLLQIGTLIRVRLFTY
jgi:hypothetical protein